MSVKRSQELPFGGRLDGTQLKRVRDATLAALRFASLPRQLTFDDSARERWVEVYGPLSRGEQGLLGAATRRAEAHVVRLAAIYATLDCSEQIGPTHLEAALAVWRYSLDSARWIFGDTLGDPTADEIWAAAKDRPAGVTRTEVSDKFSRDKKRRRDRTRSLRARRRRTTQTRDPPARTRTTRFVAFDVLAMAGEDVRPRPWEERDARLRETLPLCDRIRLIASQPATLAAHEAIVALGFEGTVLKRVDSIYRAGRHRSWVKHKVRLITSRRAALGPPGSRRMLACLL